MWRNQRNEYIFYRDVRVLNKLKNLIGAEKIYINEKWVQVYQIENIAWFFISSNNNMPIQLDDKSKGNRRFTVMKSKSVLKNWEEINKVIRDKVKVANYLAWLLENYPSIITEKSFPALENEDKKELEERWQDEANAFWDWLWDNYPEFTGKKQILEVREKLNEYCLQADISEQHNFHKFFWKNSKYPKKKIRFWEKVYTWVNIE